MKRTKYLLLCMLLILSLTAVTACSDTKDEASSSSKKDKDDRDDEKDKDDENDDEDEIGLDDLGDLLDMDEDEIKDFVENVEETQDAMSGSDGFNFDRFLEQIDQSYNSLDTALQDQHPDAFLSYMALIMGVNTVSMDVAGTNLSYIMDSTSNGTSWSESNYEWPNGAGSTLSSFSDNDGVYHYTMSETYFDSETVSASDITYDSQREYYSKVRTYDDEYDAQDGIVYTEFCSDGADGYYVQHLNILLNNQLETLTVYHFNDDSFNIYTVTRDSASEETTFVKSLSEGIPSSLESLIADFGDYGSIIYDGNNVELDIESEF